MNYEYVHRDFILKNKKKNYPFFIILFFEFESAFLGSENN